MPTQTHRPRLAFNTVADPSDWKAPVDAIFEPGGDFSLEEVVQAVRFYTATEPEVDDLGEGRARIRSCGYRFGPAGDC